MFVLRPRRVRLQGLEAGTPVACQGKRNKTTVLFHVRVEQKVLNRGLHCEGPGVYNYQSRLKFFPEIAKENFLLAKDLAKVYVYVTCI